MHSIFNYIDVALKPWQYAIFDHVDLHIPKGTCPPFLNFEWACRVNATLLEKKKVISVNGIIVAIYGQNLAHIGRHIPGGIWRPPLCYAPRTNATALVRQTCISVNNIPKSRQCVNLSHIGLRIPRGIWDPPFASPLRPNATLLVRQTFSLIYGRPKAIH